MEIGKQIKKYRAEMELSQDELAERIFVSRQSVSNWENDKNYPDVKSLVLLSSLFGVSLDILIKGDLEKMKEEIRTEDVNNFKRNSVIYNVLLFAMMLSPIPLIKLLGIPGWVIWGVHVIVTFAFAVMVERQKKRFNIQTYKEICAFMEGKQLTETEKHQEFGKRAYQKILLVACVGVLTAGIAVALAFIL
jgi:transcriptional regulator with XRE-family HTH domain